LSRARLIALVAAIILVPIVLGISITILVWFQKDEPEVHANIADHFKYGSIGSEGRSGVPYWVWTVLPEVFEDLLPEGEGQGYQRLGFLYETQAPRGRPIGVSYREDPFPTIGLNCAICHTGTLRESPEASTQLVLGMPAHQFDLQQYIRFLFATAQDERFNADTLVPAIQRANPDLGFLDRLIYRHVVIPRTRDGLLEEARLFQWMDRRPDQGPGRVDTFNPYKLNIFGLTEDPHVGTADLPSLWNQAPREGMWLHWDGNNNSVEERNKSAAIGAGASEESLDLAGMQRIEDWIATLGPPEFPPDRIDWARVGAGLEVYRQNCAICHSLDSPGVGQVVPIEEIGTDPERLNSFTQELGDHMNTLGTGRPWRFSSFRKTQGYSSMPLDGVWLRAPYLHNGSVPTLRDLLQPQEERPTVFYRGYDVYDWDNLGFVSSGPEAEARGFRFDTTQPGNGNQGHRYGTNLSEQEKGDLLEYLKTK
jgi:mono/diheme cytochrome c family protein